MSLSTNDSVTENQANRKRVCIIGGGIAGICVAKELLSKKYKNNEETAATADMEPMIDVVIYDIRNEMGGIWTVDRSAKTIAPIWPGMKVNISRDMSTLSDFSMKLHGGIETQWPKAEQVNDYFNMYASKFGVSKCFVGGTRVVAVEINQKQKANDSNNNNNDSNDRKFYVTTSKESNPSQKSTSTFDYVVCCTGLHCEPMPLELPEGETLDGFKGTIIHSSKFEPTDTIYKDANIVICGLGNSGAEIASTVSSLGCKSCVVACRTPLWIMSREDEKTGEPNDRNVTRVVLGLPTMLMNIVAEIIVSRKFKKFEKYGCVRPTTKFDNTGISLDYGCYEWMEKGILSVRPALVGAGSPKNNSNTKMNNNIDNDQFAHQVRFADGSKLNNVDILILANGYTTTYPYLSDCDLNPLETVKNEKSGKLETRAKLGHYLFSLNHPEIVFPLHIKVAGSSFPIAQAQARAIAAIWANEVPMPSLNDMRRDYEKKVTEYDAKDTQNADFNTVDFIQYMDQMADLAGNGLPWYTKLKYAAAPATPPTWRLHDKNKSVSETALKEVQRIKTWKSHQTTNNNNNNKADTKSKNIAIAVAIAGVVLYWYCR